MMLIKFSPSKRVGCLAAFALLATQSIGLSAAPASADRVVQIAQGGRSDTSAVTRTIQAAIDACGTAGGGRVVIPAGDYSVAPIQLCSNVELHIDKGATLQFSRNFADYELMRGVGDDVEPTLRSPISGDDLSNIAITGEGVIDGQGDAWRMVKRIKLTPEAWTALVKGGGVTNAEGTMWYPNEVVRDHQGALDKLLAANPPAPLEAFGPYRVLLRPRLLKLTNCKNVRLEGITVKNSPNWNVHLELCEDVQISRITVFTEEWAQNGDGIDIESCRNVVLTDSKVDAGDDSICLKSGKDEAGRLRGRPTENVTIKNCSIGTGHGGIVIGSEMSGGVRDVFVENCVMKGTGAGLRFKSVRGRGGVVENINISDCKMTDIDGAAILFDLYYATKKGEDAVAKPVTEATPQFRNFHLSNITCESAKLAFQIRGLPEMPVRDIVLEHIKIKADKAGMITFSDGIVCKDVHVEAADGSLVAIQDPTQVSLASCSGFQK